MEEARCGIDCNKCKLKCNCNGCNEQCIIANCCKLEKHKNCDSCVECKLKKDLIKEFNKLKIKDMDEVTELNILKGSFINMEFHTATGASFKLLDDDKIYLGNQLIKKNTNKCYGLAADRDYLLVCEYNENGANPEIVIYKKIK